MSHGIGLDVGGTKIAGGVVSRDGTVVDLRQVPTPDTAEGLEEAIVELASDLAAEHEVSTVGVGVAGHVARDRAHVLYAANLPWPAAVPLRETLQSRLRLPVVVENDGNAATWAEHRFGAGMDVKHLLLLTVGTGVGGGVVLDGRLHRGAFGVAGEVGHLRLVPDGLPCGCGARGCLELYASGSALVRQTQQAAALDRAGSAALVASAGSLDRITGPVITELARAGDEFAIARLAEVGRHLGEGLASLTAILDPAVVLVGGGVSAAGELLLAPLRAAFCEHQPGRGLLPEPQIRPAKLGPVAGVVGAADLARCP